MYSWLRTSSPRRLRSAPLPSGKKCMPSWFMPTCWACSAAEFAASLRQAGPPGRIGVPQGMMTCAW